MTDARLSELGPRPDPSAGWLALRDWLRARNLALRLPRARYPEDLPAIPCPSSSKGCGSCAELVSVEAGDFCGACGAPIPLERPTTPEAGLDPSLDAHT